MKKPMIFAVDDEAPIRELYQIALENAGFDCQTFADGNALFAALEKSVPALILLDIMIVHENDGYEILQKLKENSVFKRVPVIMVSAKGEEMSKVKGLNLGANDYIAKPFGVLELVARINANLRKSVPAATLRFADIEIDETKHEIRISGVPAEATLKEFELLKLLVANAGNVLPRERILSTIWSDYFLGESRTLDIHIASLRKILAGSEAKILTVRGVGYQLK